MKCPRCQSAIETSPDPGGFMVCAGCGARLRRTANQTAQAVPASVQAGAITLPPSNSPLGPRRVPSPKQPVEALPDVEVAPISVVPPRKIGDDTARVAKAAAAAAVAAAFTAPGANSPATAAAVDTLLAEVRAVRRLQDEILELLRGRADGGPSLARRPAADDDFEGMQEPAVRTNRKKRVLLVDDDVEARTAVENVLTAGEIPVTVIGDGNGALASIARDKPDVIVLELGITGAMAGKDVVNMIKATMEWVDLPIILYTRVPMEGQKEARQIHGADDYVAKTAGGPEAVLAKVISFFRKP
jgi:CheY-like chemotaxis protein